MKRHEIVWSVCSMAGDPHDPFAVVTFRSCGRDEATGEPITVSFALELEDAPGLDALGCHQCGERVPVPAIPWPKTLTGPHHSMN